MKASFEEDVLKRLDVLIGLLLDRTTETDGVTLTDRVSKLLSLGIYPADIARILGRPLNSVTGIISGLRKRQGKNG